MDILYLLLIIRYQVFSIGCSCQFLSEFVLISIGLSAFINKRMTI